MLIICLGAYISAVNYDKIDISYGIFSFLLFAIFFVAISPISQCFILSKAKNKSFKIMLKKKFFNKLLKPFNDIQWKQSYNMETKSVISAYELKKSKLFSDGLLQIKADDEFIGKYKGVTFRISEASIMTTPNNNRDTVFKGLIVCFKFNKN